MPTPRPAIISREEAYSTGKTRYFTGTPCRQGHVAQRYVRGGACVDCQSKFSRRIHPFRKDLAPYICPTYWVPRNTSLNEYEMLESYLQKCIDAFFEQTRLKP